MRVLAAMSGGVDSAVAAARAVDAGHDVVGVHLALSETPDALRSGSRGCCSREDADDARRAADVLGIPFYIWDFAEVEVEKFPQLRLELKYGPNGERVIRHIRRVSKPGRRIYNRATDLRPILNGLGISIISTSRGVISDREARQRNLGGEVLCEVW